METHLLGQILFEALSVQKKLETTPQLAEHAGSFWI